MSPLHAILALVVMKAAPLPPCTIVTTGDIYVREPTETWIVGAVLRDTIADIPRDTTAVARFRVNRGQAILVESVAGNGESRIQPGDTVVVFLWSLGASCDQTANPSLPVGSRQHFQLSLRQDSTWIEGRPTLDVGATGGLGVHPGRNKSEITVDDYARFVSLIPTRAEWDADCRPGVQRTNRWIRDHVQDPTSTRPFGHVAVSLVSACETSITGKGNALLRGGVDSVPPVVRRWTETEGCEIPSAWADNNLQAVSGRFLPAPAEDQWAIVCVGQTGWRLLIVEPGQGRILAELARAVGSPRQHQLQVGPPAFFGWARLFDPDNVRGVLPPPEFDAVLLDDYAFFWRGNALEAAWYECCYFEY